ncbi:serine hydrolase domain-containing protein [Salegentibacter sp. F188]|uniref:Serine hydrolase domain-containing protein n=1 Tax=Autumnicola patrickiae TaxID=3075591 RepID=A0ABU3E3Z3_9FLAO|nr:serine hydrolase domain-containing protein [Salegentibacter sp. F188]MDT0690625.1 serine hydrolase domain-containing protein [Salegentibacter sp. F188]
MLFPLPLKLKQGLTGLLFFASTFAFHAQTASSQHSEPLSEDAPETVGMSSERLDRISNMLQTAVDENQIPGAVALIVKDGKIVFHEAFGEANAEGEKLEKDDVFRIASQTKAITATAVMMLWEEGKFQLDDPISKYIPEFEDPQVLESFNEADSSYTAKPADKEITIRHLLTHTSGLGYGMIDADARIRKIYQKAGVTELFTTDNVEIEEVIKKLGKLPLHHNPGEKFTYSMSLDVLGYFIEVVSGQSFSDYLVEHIFDPLEMDDTRFYQPERNEERLVSVQYKEDGEWKNLQPGFYDPNYPVKGARTFYSGGAGLSSTAEDYATFLQMYLNKGELNGTRLLSRTTVESILENHSGDLFGGKDKFHGIAFSVVTPEGEAMGGIGSTGTFDWGGYFNTQYFADPEENIIGILMKQTSGGTGDQTDWKFRQMVMAGVDN